MEHTADLTSLCFSSVQCRPDQDQLALPHSLHLDGLEAPTVTASASLEPQPLVVQL